MFRKKMSMLSKDTEGIRGKKKTKIKHLKTTISETKITLDGINSRLDTEEEMVSKYEDRAIKAIHNETQREGGKKHISELQDDCRQSYTGLAKICSDFSVRSYRNTQWTFWPTQYMCSYSPQGRGRVRQNVNTQWLKNFPNLTKTIIPWSQEVKKKKKS